MILTVWSTGGMMLTLWSTGEMVLSVWSTGGMILCSRFRASQVYVHKCPMRCNNMLSIFYFILLQYHSTCFGCRPHPSSGVHKTVVAATGTSRMIVQLPNYDGDKLGQFLIPNS